MSDRAVASVLDPVAESVRPRCPNCRVQLQGFTGRRGEPDTELVLRCACGFEMTFSGPGLVLDGPRAL